MNQKLVRPNDYLVEMYKTDVVMQKIKSNLVKQQVKIQNFEERKLRRDNKKFAKKVFLNSQTLILNHHHRFNKLKFSKSIEKREEISMLLINGKKKSSKRVKMPLIFLLS